MNLPVESRKGLDPLDLELLLGDASFSPSTSSFLLLVRVLLLLGVDTLALVLIRDDLDSPLRCRDEEVEGAEGTFRLTGVEALLFKILFASGDSVSLLLSSISTAIAAVDFLFDFTPPERSVVSLSRLERDLSASVGI